ncbi:hypothetical protein JL720_5273 [Aureococcus anophagefferens]|nr:hypothetical protein JL720_5273 [Aureococcus anophagefferens]
MLLQDRQDSSRSSPPLRNKFLIEQNHQIVKSESMAVSAAHAAALLETQRQIETMIDGLESAQNLFLGELVAGARRASARSPPSRRLRDRIYASTGGRSAEILNYTKQGRTFHHCLETTRVRDASDGVDYFCTESFARRRRRRRGLVT